MDEVSLNTEPTNDDDVDGFEIDGECAMTEYVGESGNLIPGENPLPPAVGMEFESYDDVYYFYNCYAKQQGFGVRVSNTWYRKSKERYRGKLSCSSAGFKKKSEANRPRPETRTGCMAMIKFMLMENKRWRIIEVELGHNHLTNPTSTKFYKSHRIVDLGSKRPLSIDGAEEVHKIRLFRTVLIGAEDNGVINFDEGEFRKNVDHDSKELKLKTGDAQEMLNFFTRMQLSSPNFFYVMDISETGCLQNVFWAGLKCRAAYGYFGDIVFIDTTALMENYKVPLVVFTGVNHHAQAVSLGCGLVSGQTAESFIWLFRAWLTYMVGHPPQTVVSSQCEALKTAVAEVFPRSFHCLSLTNIMNQVSGELVGLEEFDSIRMAFTRTVHHSLRVEEFEAAWKETVQSHGLSDNRCLQMIYQDRKNWVPVYLKEVFLAGMFPVKENERMASPFKEYLSNHTSLKQFLSSYDQALLELDQQETVADVESRNSDGVLKSTFYFELQLLKLYTNDIFKKFQDEVEGMCACFSLSQVSSNGLVFTYIVKEDILLENSRETRDFEVIYSTSDAEVLCACALFNFKGYLCRHALCILNQIGLEEIPRQYVLARWRKDIKRNYTFDHGWNGINVNNPVHRYDNLYRCVLKVVEEGRKSQDCYKFACQSLDEILNKVRIQED